MKLTIVVLFFAASLHAQLVQTLVSPAQIACRTNQGVAMALVTAAVATPSGFVKIPVICAILDPLVFRVDTTTTPPTVRLIAGPITGPVFVDGETPQGATDGTNSIFTLAFPPTPSTSLVVYRNGLRQALGTDYTLSGNAVSFLPGAVPEAGAVLRVDYRR